MSITNYTELQASVASWLKRNDLAAVIPDFITLAETDLNGDLDARAMETTVTLTCSTASRFVALPSDMTEMKRLLMVDSDPATVLEYKSPDQLTEDNPFLLDKGRPINFTITGSNVELSPPPDSAYPLELLYQQRIPALSAGNPTNWLLTICPNAYLFGALIKGAAFMMEEARLPVWRALYQEAIDSVNSVDWYSGSTMRVRAR
jgi:hypothetical protein